VAGVCFTSHRQPISIITSNGIFSASACPVYNQVRRVAYRIGGWSKTIACAALQLPFSVHSDSSNQNTMEFVAVVLGLLLAWRTNLTTFYYDLHGDNMSSLAWARSNRVNSILARRDNLTAFEHIPGSMNIVFDGLSSNVPPEQLGLDPLLMYHTAADHTVNEFIQLCNPALQLNDMSSHTSLLKQCYRLLSTWPT